MKVEEPGKIVYTVTTTATAEEWEKFRDGLDFVAEKFVNVPGGVHHFRREIDSLLGQARKIYWPAEPSSNASASEEKDCACPGGQAEHLNSCVYCR